MRCRIVPVLIAVVAVAGCQSASSTFNITVNNANTSKGDPSFHAKGVKEALDAIAAGTLKLKEYPPTPAPAWHAEYIRLLKERNIGYEVPSLRPGMSEADFIEEIKGWNIAMTAEINKRFGPDTLQKLQQEAQAKRNKK